MKLLLLESVAGLGRPGDQVNVKDGYARNFLLPQRHAVRLTDDSLRMLGSLNRKADEEERALISSMEELAAKITGTLVSVEARATDEGHLFGSVTEKDVHLALVAAGWDVEQRMVRMEFHIKDSGESEVGLHLHGEIIVPITVNVVPLDMDGMVIDLSDPEPLDEAEGDDDDGGDDASEEAVASTADQAPAAADA